jgi:hypothetical protein
MINPGGGITTSATWKLSAQSICAFSLILVHLIGLLSSPEKPDKQRGN